ncbi:hypothetical protein [Flavobacterium cerinum]|uniref:Uncharacterized protein n=1 Tax=Flavobacterium cerinum TaxID=2502784 RepID=A0ABY5IT49_9FLAO|nr:hypothetical protein [Flavobacterium cerinum]UUC46020.1 hypothetical protein NOX80_02170 [Flavobacterium cerinum]
MKLIIEQLKKGIQTHPSVLNSTLSSVKTWKRAQYIILSEIMSHVLARSEFLQGNRKNELGTTISSTTLHRIFTNDYTAKENLDLRFLKTLDKLAIFIGYPSLNNFIANHHGKPIDHTEHTAYFEHLIYQFCEDEFQCLLKLPEVNLSGLSDFIFEDGPLTQRITGLLEKYAQLNLHLNTDNNRSNFEIFDFRHTRIDDSLAVISAKELWNLEWRDATGTINNVYNKVNLQTYFIKKQHNIWKIWDNYNPDYHNLSLESSLNMLQKIET